VVEELPIIQEPPPPPQPSAEEQMREYQERRNVEFRQQQENRQREQQRVQIETMQQRQQEFQSQFRQNIESRQQLQIQEQQQLIERINQEVDQFDEERIEIPEKERIEDMGLIDVLKEETGFDPIEGEVKLTDFIEMDKINNVVFKFGDRYYLVDKSRLNNMVSLGMKDNSIFYGCSCEIEDDWTNPHTWNLLNYVVILDPIYFNVQHLGLPIRYVNLNDIRAVLSTGASHSYYVIEKPIDYVIIPSFASDNVLKHGVGSMSGIHCQTGQEDTIYVIKKFTPNFI
jgi:hypothetical protein